MSLLPQTYCGIFSFFKGASKNHKSIRKTILKFYTTISCTHLFFNPDWQFQKHSANIVLEKKTGCWHFSKHFIWVVAYGTVKMGWLEPIFDNSYLTATTQPLDDTQNIWHFALTHLIKKKKIKSPLFLVFLSLQTWEVAISEMGWLDPILDSKLIPLVLFYTDAIVGQMNYWSTKN